jgi:hypothetical protein
MIARSVQRISVAAGAAVAALAVAWPCASVAGNVLVEAPIEVAEFADNLEAAGKQRAEAGIAAEIVKLATRHFPVLGWTGDPAAAHAATLRLALVSRPTQPKPAVSLVWRGEIATEALDMPGLLPVDLYGPLQFARETHDADRLVAQIADKLNAWFSLDTNRQAFSQAFLRHVPVATQAEADNQARGIVVPISLASARMDRRSMLTIRLILPIGGTAREEGEIQVSNLLARGVGAAATLGRVQQVNVVGAPDIAGPNAWDPQIADILSRALTLTVYVEQYRFSEVGGVSDGLAVQP